MFVILTSFKNTPNATSSTMVLINVLQLSLIFLPFLSRMRGRYPAKGGVHRGTLVPLIFNFMMNLFNHFTKETFRNDITHHKTNKPHTRTNQSSKQRRM